MTTKNHTALVDGLAGSAATFEGPIGQLDDALADYEAGAGDYVVSGGLAGTSVTLDVMQPACKAFVLNTHVSVAAGGLTFPATKDNYVDIDSTGAYHVTSVANGAAAPAIFANSIRLYMAVTSGTAVTAVTDLRTLCPLVLVSGTQTFTGIKTFANGFAMGVGAVITGTANFGGAVIVNGLTTLASLTAGAAVLASLGVTGDVAISGALDVTGNVSFAGGFTIPAPLALLGASDAVQLLVKGNAVQTNDVFKVQNSAAVTLFKVANSGATQVASGGLTVTAGGLTVTAGGLVVSDTGVAITGTLGTDMVTANAPNTFANNLLKLSVNATAKFTVDQSGKIIWASNMTNTAGSFTVSVSNGATQVMNLTATGVQLSTGLLVGADPTGVAGKFGLGVTNGLGNGAATNLQAPAFGTGTGPATLTVSQWIKAFNGVTAGWIPFFV